MARRDGSGPEHRMLTAEQRRRPASDRRSRQDAAAARREAMDGADGRGTAPETEPE